MDARQFDQISKYVARRLSQQQVKSSVARLRNIAGQFVQDAAAGRSALDRIVATPAGAPITIRALLAAGKPLVLLFTDLRCGPCYELLPDLGGWRRAAGERFTFALVSSGDLEVNRSLAVEYDLAHVLVQRERELIDALGVKLAPAALVLGAGGQIARDVTYGTPAIRALVAELTGVVLEQPVGPRGKPIRRGEVVPDLTRLDLDGRPVDLGGARVRPTMLLFWSPGCSRCAELRPEIRAWERQPDADLVIVSRGPVTLNREAGFQAPLVLDDDRAVAAAFGVSGTPAAVMINRQGTVASDVAQGTASVRALAQTVWPEAVRVGMAVEPLLAGCPGR